MSGSLEKGRRGTGGRAKVQHFDFRVESKRKMKKAGGRVKKGGRVNLLGIEKGWEKMRCLITTDRCEREIKSVV